MITMVMDPRNKSLPAHILLVDDELDHLNLMGDLLVPRYHVTPARTAKQALEICRQRTFHLGILDVRLPDLPDPQLMSRLRTIDPQMGFVLVTAWADLQEAVRAVRDLGVLDYIAKPFYGKEFVRCVDNAVARLSASSRVILADLTICLESRRVWQAGRLLSLSKQEFDLLAYLACRPGQVISYERLLEDVWGCDATKGAIDMIWNAMKRLRAKLGEDPNSPRYIHTARGSGYSVMDSNSRLQTFQN